MGRIGLPWDPLCSLLFSWIVLPIGIYSATHKYSFADNFFTFFFHRVEYPSFLIAPVLMVISSRYFGASGGLFPGPMKALLSWAKFVDFLTNFGSSSSHRYGGCRFSGVMRGTRPISSTCSMSKQPGQAYREH